jgi:hypothetical protein
MAAVVAVTVDGIWLIIRFRCLLVFGYAGIQHYHGGERSLNSIGNSSVFTIEFGNIGGIVQCPCCDGDMNYIY